MIRNLLSKEPGARPSIKELMESDDYKTAKLKAASFKETYDFMMQVVNEVKHDQEAPKVNLTKAEEPKLNQRVCR